MIMYQIKIKIRSNWLVMIKFLRHLSKYTYTTPSYAYLSYINWSSRLLYCQWVNTVKWSPWTVYNNYYYGCLSFSPTPHLVIHVAWEWQYENHNLSLSPLLYVSLIIQIINFSEYSTCQIVKNIFKFLALLIQMN